MKKIAFAAAVLAMLGVSAPFARAAEPQRAADLPDLAAVLQQIGEQPALKTPTAAVVATVAAAAPAARYQCIAAWTRTHGPVGVSWGDPSDNLQEAIDSALRKCSIETNTFGMCRIIWSPSPECYKK